MVIAGVVMVGCATQESPSREERIGESKGSTALSNAPPRTGFLGDYSRLVKSSTHDNTWQERSAQIERYKVFMVEEVKVYPKMTTGGEALDAETSAMLGDYFRTALIDSISGAYEVTTTPGPNVASIRAAVTEIALYQAATGVKEARMGGAAMELEVVDSITEQRLFAVIDSGSVSGYDNPPVPTQRFEHARVTFRHWASRLLLRLRT